MTVDMQKDVYAPGERVVVKCYVDNESKKDVAKLKAKLMQDITVRCRGEKCQETVEVQRSIFPGVKAKSKFEGELAFDLPVTVTPSAKGTLVQNQYHLDFECDVALAGDLEVHPFITIALPNNSNFGYTDMYADFTKGSWKQQ